MEERTIKLSLEKAKEYYEAGGALRNIALQAFQGEKLRTLTEVVSVHGLYQLKRSRDRDL